MSADYKYGSGKSDYKYAAGKKTPRVWEQPQVWVAIIGAIAAIVVGYWQFVLHHSERKIAVAGRVSDQHGSVSGAKVRLEQAGQSPEVRFSDSEGDFRFDSIPAMQATLRIEASGYSAYVLEINPSASVFQEIHLTGGKPEINPEIVKLVSEFDNRLEEVQGVQKQLADPSKNHSDRVALSVIVWRVWFGDHEYRPTLPEFNNVRWVGIVTRLRVAGVTQGSGKAEQAIHDIEQGNPDGVYAPEFLNQRTEILRDYSNLVLHPAIGEH